MIDKLQFGFGRRLPVILQTELAECGSACLAMISSYYGHYLDMNDIRSKMPSAITGTTLKQLMSLSNEMNLAGRAVRLEIEDLEQLKMPCILHWDLSHFVVLKEVTSRGIVLHDPGFGVRKMSMDEASRHFTGVAMELIPLPTFKEKKANKSVGLSDLIGSIVGLKRSIAVILLLSVAIEVFSVISPLFQQWVMDGVIVQNDHDLLLVLSIGFFIMMLIQVCFSTLRQWMIIYFSNQINVQWTSGVLAKLLRLPMEYFFKRHLGDIMSRFDAVQSIRDTLTGAALNAVLDGIMAIVALALMCAYSIKLAMISVVAMAVYILVRSISYEAFRNASEELIIHSAKQSSHLLETVRGVQSIKLFNREVDRRNQWINLLINTTNRELATERMNTVFQLVNTLVFGIESILVVYLGAVLVMSGDLTIGMIFAYGAYKMQFTSRISELINLFYELRMLSIQRERLADIVLHEPEPTGGVGLPKGIPDIEIKNLRFRYSPTEPWVLDGINLKIEAGESVALVGPSGCGKTTLLKLMLGLLTPTEGEILIMGKPISKIGLEAWRERLGAVMQEDQLFAGNIAENIAFFAPLIDMAKVKKSARLAAVENDILAMAMGWQTLIGDMGAALSGGQKQRILLARALYKQPNILLLDEATSHLDNKNERLVNEAICKLKITKIVIAHRTETIKMADRAIELPSKEKE